MQGQNWDPSFDAPYVDNQSWKDFCQTLGNGTTEGIVLEGKEVPGVVVNYANWLAAVRGTYSFIDGFILEAHRMNGLV